jgi:endonuclease/exonuclease/phosphatase family metal-dependent hydrolase
MNKKLRLVFLLVLIPVLYLGIVIIIGTITNYRPPETEVISSLDSKFIISDTATYTALIWNIGYAGLGAGMDFFYDGGKRVRDSKDNTYRNFQMIKKILDGEGQVDFIMLQEVDKKSKRSYEINEVEEINVLMAEHFPFFASNYKSFFVPLPLFMPMGQVNSGLLTLSSEVPQNTIRYSYPGNYVWPKSNFMLDRCFLVCRYTLKNGKDLLVINTHNSAYDNGLLRKKQLGYLKTFLLDEEKKGNYILVGGDWNQSPPDFEPGFTGQVFDTLNRSYISSTFLSNDWKWIYDPSEPTNRRISVPYQKGETPVTLIDFYLASPNIDVLRCKTISLDFKYTDHQPVFLKFKLKADE